MGNRVINKTFCDQCKKDIPEGVEYIHLESRYDSGVQVECRNDDEKSGFQTIYGEIYGIGDFCNVECATEWYKKLLTAILVPPTRR